MTGRTIPIEDWRDVQVVFELGAPVRVVSRLSGISERAIRDRARREDWGRPPFAASGRQRRVGGIDRHGAMRRLWAALETQLADLDGAEEAKIASLARTLEKLVGVERGLDAGNGAEAAGGDGGADGAPDEADFAAFLDELARRVEAIP